MLFALVPDPFELVGVFFAIGISMLTLYAGFIGIRALHKKVDEGGRRELDSGQHERLVRLEEVEARLAELEDRVDFTERVLSRPEVKALVSGEGQ
jgi:hypothetical protein